MNALENTTKAHASIEAAITAEISAVRLTPDSHVDFFRGDDEQPVAGKLIIQISLHRENARTLNDAGRFELAADQAAADLVLNVARNLGTVTRDGDGSGQYGSTVSYLLNLKTPTS